MSVLVRAGNLDGDAAPLLRLLQEQLSSSIDKARFDWLYRACPHGEARVWVASETESGRLVGAAAVFPRKINYEGGSGTGFVFGDFCVSANQRSLGLAIQLQRKCLEGVQSGLCSAGYDLPSRSMLAVYRRLGIKEETAVFNRMVKLLRADAQIAARVKPKSIARAASRAANAVLAVGSGSLRMRTNASVQVQEGRCGKEFTALAQEIGGSLGTCVDRSAEYLNWRYLDHPQHKYEILAARNDGKLKGYLAFLQEGSRATLVDWFCVENREIRKDLVRAAVSLLKTRGCSSVQASILTSHAYHADLKSLGFRSRESSPVIFFGKSESEPNGMGTSKNWLLMDGDRES